MDSTKQIQSLLDALQADKTMAQPWKNYAISDARRLQALIEIGLSTTNRVPPPDLPQPKVEVASNGCMCPPGGKRNVNCPVHGIN
jgi:hypothetical protein